ncbi:uncharacterized protein C16orf78 homolog [Marmota marmota marmota]|uniref:uncharacterized protein C16orf78 homolog n=1 Tax=Marmota marmota marmota TaxID=9994 RepID=UPI0020926753|nr:uncharacterized protein C16orf78 homolog [Marmota marmota marmota]
MSQDQEDPKRAMPTERKSVWRTPEERRMSDLTRVLEWLERRRGKKKLGLQVGAAKKNGGKTLFTFPPKQDEGKSKTKVELPPKAAEKEKKKRKVVKQQVGANRPVSLGEFSLRKAERKDGGRSNGAKGLWGALQAASLDPKPRSPLPSPALTHGGICPFSELDIKDAIALESTQRPSMFRRQSSIGDPLLQEAIFSSRRGTLIRDWGSKAQDVSFERKLKTLMDKSTEPKMESLKMLKPEEVLSCRYLRLSKNNIRTLLKLCKDAGLNMDIHPHMNESEMDSKKVFGRSSSTAP